MVANEVQPVLIVSWIRRATRKPMQRRWESDRGLSLSREILPGGILTVNPFQQTLVWIGEISPYNDAWGDVRRMENADRSARLRAKETSPLRKPYQKPEFRFERVFETMALACGKISPVQVQCRFNRKTS